MKKVISRFLLYLIILISSQLYCQDMFTINKNYSSILESFIKKKEINKDTIIIFLISPNAAPRLENTINAAYMLLEKIGLGGNVIGIINHPKKKYAEFYTKKCNFKFLCYYDDDDSIFQDLGFYYRIPPTLLLIEKKGNILNSLTLYGQTINQITIKNFLIGRFKVQKNFTLEKDTIGFNTFDFSFPTIKIIDTIKLRDSEIEPFGILRTGSLNQSGNLIALSDFDNYEIMVFSKYNGDFKYKVKLKQSERMFFSKNFPSDYWAYLEREGIIKNMFFSPAFYNDTIIAFLASFPKLSYQIDGKDTVLHYNVVSPIVYYDIKNSNLLKIIEFVNDTILKAGLVPSYNLFFDHQKRTFIVPCRKGYPTMGFLPPKDTSYIINPITPSFYSFSPLFLVFDSETGKYLYPLGKLNLLNQKIGSGYYFANQLLFIENTDYFTYQRLDEFVLINDKDTLPIKTYYNKQITRKYEIAPSKEPPSPSELDRVSDQISAFVINIFKNDNFFYVIWKLKEKGKNIHNSNFYVLQKYHLPTKKLINEWIIPGKLSDNSKLVFTLFDSFEKKLLGFYENNNEDKFVVYLLE